MVREEVRVNSPGCHLMPPTLIPFAGLPFVMLPVAVVAICLFAKQLLGLSQPAARDIWSHSEKDDLLGPLLPLFPHLVPHVPLRGPLAPTPSMDRGDIKGGNSQGGNVDLVDLVDLFKPTTWGAERPCGARQKAAPIVSLFLLVFLYVSAELNKLTISTKSTTSTLPL